MSWSNPEWTRAKFRSSCREVPSGERVAVWHLPQAAGRGEVQDVGRGLRPRRIHKPPQPGRLPRNQAIILGPSFLHFRGVMTTTQIFIIFKKFLILIPILIPAEIDFLTVLELIPGTLDIA